MVVERLLDMLFIVVLAAFHPLRRDHPAGLDALVCSGVRVSWLWVVSSCMIIAANQRERALRLADSLLQHIRFLNREAWLRRLDELLAGLSSLTSLRDGSSFSWF